MRELLREVYSGLFPGSWVTNGNRRVTELRLSFLSVSPPFSPLPCSRHQVWGKRTVPASGLGKQGGTVLAGQRPGGQSSELCEGPGGVYFRPRRPRLSQPLALLSRDGNSLQGREPGCDLMGQRGHCRWNFL